MSAKPLYTVIVADDEDELREAVCTMIPWQELGFCLVGNASNGLDALQLVEKPVSYTHLIIPEPGCQRRVANPPPRV